MPVGSGNKQSSNITNNIGSGGNIGNNVHNSRVDKMHMSNNNNNKHSNNNNNLLHIANNNPNN